MLDEQIDKAFATRPATFTDTTALQWRIAEHKRHLIQLYIAADVLGDPLLKERVIEYWLVHATLYASSIATAHHLRMVWERTGRGSGLRNLMMDHLIVCYDGHDQAQFVAWFLKLTNNAIVPGLNLDLNLWQLKWSRSPIDARARLTLPYKTLYYDAKPVKASA